MLSLGWKFPGKTLAEAREEVRRLTANGDDPIELARREDREKKARRAAEDAKPTVAALFNQYDAMHLSKLRSGDERRRLFLKHVLPVIGQMRVADVHRADVVGITDSQVSVGKRVLANRILSGLKHFFSFAADRGVIDISPIERLNARSAGGTEKPRERALTIGELEHVWRFLSSEECRLDPRTIGTFKLLILSGQRLGEVLAMEWEHLDLEKMTWTMPDERTKNGKSHTVPLSVQALDVIEVIRPLTGTERFVFGGYRPMTTPAMGKAVRRLLESKSLAMTPWTPHDLRRTVATRLAEEVKTPPHVVEALLNHTPPRIVATYNKASYLPEMREALDAWGAKVESLTAHNVVQFPAKATVQI